MIAKKTETTIKKAPTTKAKPRIKKTTSGASLAHGVGRRKSAVARAWLKRGKGDIIVNGLNYREYFDTAITRMDAAMPLSIIPHADKYDAYINISGSGKVAQAGAVKLAISRAFVAQDAELKPLLRKNGLLTVDSRVKERKKYGQKAARRKFQFVKR